MEDELALEHEQYFRRVFQEFDVDGNCEISKQEFRVLMGALGQNLSESKIDELLNEIDKDKSGTIDCDQFLHFMHLYSWAQGRVMKKADPQTEFRKAFKIFDRDGNGSISLSQLEQVMKNLERPLTASELQEIFNDVGWSGKEEIDLQEFVRLLMNRGHE